MKKLVLPALGILMSALMGCNNKDSNNMEYYYNYPAVVGYDASSQPVVATVSGNFLTPQLQERLYTDLMAGDALIADFEIDLDNQPLANIKTVTNFLGYSKLEKTFASSAYQGETATSDFNFSIDSITDGITISDNSFGSVMFLVFEHTSPADQAIIYEMEYDPEDTEEIPSLYVRAEKDGKISEGDDINIVHFYSFDVTFFLQMLKNSGKTKFNIMYKTGKDESGKEIFKPWDKNPCEPDFLKAE